MKCYGVSHGSQYSQNTIVSEGGAKIFNKQYNCSQNPQTKESKLQTPQISTQPVMQSKIQTPQLNPQQSSFDVHTYFPINFVQISKRTPLLSHHYLVKKYGNKLPGGETFNIDDLIQQISDIFCIVCEQYISESKIDQHCKFCSAVPKNEIEQIEGVQQKLAKCNYLISRIKKMLKIYCTDKQQVIQYLQMLWKCVNDITICTDEETLQSHQDDLELFSAFFNEQEGEEVNQEKLLQQIMTVLTRIIDFTGRKLQLMKQNNKVSDFLKESLAHQSLAHQSLAHQSLAHQSLAHHQSYAHQSKANQSLVRQSIQKRNPFEEIHTNNYQNKVQPFETSFADHQQFSSALHQSFQPVGSKLGYHSSFHNFQSKENGIVQEESSLDESQVQSDPDFIRNAFKIAQQEIMQPQKSIIKQPDVVKSKKQENKTVFFNLAAQLKEGYPLDHPAQSILIAGLYEKANRAGGPNGALSPSEYEAFIKKHYDQQ